MEAYRRLNRRQQRYVDARVLCGTGSEAVRRAGIKRRDGRPIERPEQLAWRLNRNPLIEQAYQERKAQAMAAWEDRVQRWLTELDRIATFDKASLYDEHGNFRPMHELPEEARAAIAGVDQEDLFGGSGKERTRIGQVRKVRIWNKNEAIKTLLQFVGKLPERHEHTGKNGGPIRVANSPDELTDAQLAAIATQTKARGGSEPGSGGAAPAQPAPSAT